MPMASMDNLGAHLGLYEVETPSGLKVEITPEEEAAITKDVILWKLRQDLTADERMKQGAIDSAIGAVGNAVGFAIGGAATGYILAKVLGVAAGPGR